jgi:hypothetical protein
MARAVPAEAANRHRHPAFLPPAVSDLKKSIDCCHKLEIPIVGIVENMSFLPVIKKISWLQKFLSTIFCSIKFNFLDGKIKNNIGS